MTPITLRNLPPDIARKIRRTARAKNLSRNRAVISLLEKKTEAGRTRGKTAHHDLDALAGTWSQDEADAFDRTLARQRAVDEDLWK